MQDVCKLGIGGPMAVPDDNDANGRGNAIKYLVE